jgi:hypothetical protein
MSGGAVWLHVTGSFSSTGGVTDTLWKKESEAAIG